MGIALFTGVNSSDLDRSSALGSIGIRIAVRVRPNDVVDECRIH